MVRTPLPPHKLHAILPAPRLNFVAAHCTQRQLYIYCFYLPLKYSLSCRCRTCQITIFGQILNDGPCTTWARPTLGTAPRASILVTGSPWWRLGWRARASMPSGTSLEPWPRRIQSSKARSLSRRPPSRRSRRRSRRLARPCSR